MDAGKLLVDPGREGTEETDCQEGFQIVGDLLAGIGKPKEVAVQLEAVYCALDAEYLVGRGGGAGLTSQAEVVREKREGVLEEVSGEMLDDAMCSAECAEEVHVYRASLGSQLAGPAQAGWEYA